MADQFEESIKKTRNCISSIFNRFYTWKTLQNSSYNDIYKKDNSFWVAVTPSLKDGFLIELAKIFEEHTKTNDVLSVYYLIKLIPGVVEKEKINKEIKNHEKTIKNLKGWRDKLLAHRDKKYILNPSKISDKFPLKNIEIENLINLLEKILGIIEETKTGKSISYCFSVIKEESQTGAENIIKILKKGYDTKKKELKEELEKYRKLYDTK